MLLSGAEAGSVCSRSAHGNSNGSHCMKHESCRAETVVFGEAGLPR